MSISHVQTRFLVKFEKLVPKIGCYFVHFSIMYTKTLQHVFDFSKSQVPTVHFSKCHQIYGERRGQITVRSLRSKTSPSPGVMEGGGKDTIEQTGGIPPVKSMHPAAPTAQPPSVCNSSVHDEDLPAVVSAVKHCHGFELV